MSGLSAETRATLEKAFAEDLANAAIARLTGLKLSAVGGYRAFYFSGVPWPSADIVGRIITLACIWTSDDPVALIQGTPGLRGRVYAFRVIRAFYPRLKPDRIAAVLSDPLPLDFVASFGGALEKKAKWYEPEAVAWIIERMQTQPPEPETPAPEKVPTIPLRVPAPSAKAIPAAPRPVAKAMAPPVVAKPAVARFDAPSGVMPSYRPDAPTVKRGVDILTAEICGDPTPGRSALANRATSSEPVSRPKVSLGGRGQREAAGS